MRKYRVYYRISMSNYAVTHTHSVVVSALHKQHAISTAVRTLNAHGRVCIPTGYVTIVGKPDKPF